MDRISDSNQSNRLTSKTNSREYFEHHIKKYITSTTKADAGYKSRLLTCIQKLNLTSDEARSILEGLDSIPRNSQMIASTKDIVITALHKLKDDHRSLFFHYSSTESYKVAIQFLTDLQNNASKVTTGTGRGLFGFQKYKYYISITKILQQNRYLTA